jgi:hypothetical protein
MARHWVVLMRPLLRYSVSRDAYVLRWVGNTAGPVLKVDRRRHPQPPFGGLERRTRAA